MQLCCGEGAPSGRGRALALSPPCIRAYFIPIRVKRVAGTDGTHTTVYPQLREINLGPISGRPRRHCRCRCRGTNDFPQRRTRSNETVCCLPCRKIYYCTYSSTCTFRIHAAFFCATDISAQRFFPRERRVRAAAREGLMEILNRARRRRYKLYDIHRDTNVTAILTQLVAVAIANAGLCNYLP